MTEIKIRQQKIRSYVIRAARLTKRQQRGLQSTNLLKIANEDVILNFKNIFSNNNPVICDIGFGMGVALIKQAQQFPQYNYLAVDVYTPGIGSLLADIEELGLTNIRVINKDAYELISKNITSNGFHKVQLLYPDPWPKKRHHKRRLVTDDFLTICAKVLQPQGVIQIITDWCPYADSINDLIDTNKLFKASELSKLKGLSHPDKLVSSYAQKAIKKQHKIHNLVFSLI